MTETIRESTITLRETDLFSAVCCALESGEFVQIRRAMYDRWNGRCALGVAVTVMRRAGLASGQYWELHPQFGAITRRAGALLGCGDVAEANDAGHSFTLIAAALRRARIDVEAGDS